MMMNHFHDLDYLEKNPAIRLHLRGGVPVAPVAPLAPMVPMAVAPVASVVPVAPVTPVAPMAPVPVAPATDPNVLLATDPNVLLFITTHFSDSHVKFMETCWPHTVSTVPLVQDADVLLYTSKDPPSSFLRLFRNITVQKYDNPGYQAGAIQAVVDLEKTWMGGYL